MKLFEVSVMDDADSESVLVVANSIEEAEQKVEEMDWSCLIFIIAREITEVDGYSVSLSKIENQ